MKSFLAFLKKDVTEQWRCRRVMIIGIIFAAFGIMNAGFAKLTPLLLEATEDMLAASGMSLQVQPATAVDSWLQFFANIPMALIAFVLIQGGAFTREYKSGTLVLSLTKGLDRYKVIFSKTIVLFSSWTYGYFLCFGVNYLANVCLWTPAGASHLLFATFSWWLFGIWVIALMILFSVLSSSQTGVFLGTGGVVFGLYMISIIPKIGKFLPTYAAGGGALIYGTAEPKTYVISLCIAFACTVACIGASIPLFNKKQL